MTKRAKTARSLGGKHLTHIKNAVRDGGGRANDLGRPVANPSQANPSQVKALAIIKGRPER